MPAKMCEPARLRRPMSGWRAVSSRLLRLVLLLAIAMSGARIVRSITDALCQALSAYRVESGVPAPSTPLRWPSRRMQSMTVAQLARFA